MSSVSLEGKAASKRKYFEDRQGSSGHQKIRKLGKKKISKTPTKVQKDKDKLGMMEMDEEAMLEKLVLGDLSSVLEKLGEDNDVFPRISMDTEGDSGVGEGNSTNEDENDENPSTSKKQPAWHDEEDSDLCTQEDFTLTNRKHTLQKPGNSTNAYTGLLKQRFTDIIGTPKWAQLKDKEENDSTDSEDEILQHGGKFISKSHASLPRNKLNIKKLFDLNCNTKCEGPVITAVQFHPKSTVALVAGLSGIASIVQVDGRNNNKLHNVRFEQFAIDAAKFTTDGNNFVVCSKRKPYYYVYDMLDGRSLKIEPQTATPLKTLKYFQMSPDGQIMAVAGNFGFIFLLSARSGECMGTLKMNGEVIALAFNVDGSQLFSHGDTGIVYIWDVGSRSCLFQFYDDGCVSGKAIALSPNGQYVATGSSQGVVNIYESSSLVKSNGTPTPAKILYNLTTSVSSLVFNASSEILAMCSNVKRDGVKMVHFPSMTVFSNFPKFNEHLGRVGAMDFSINSGYFSVASNENKAHLFRLGHYGNY